MIETVEALPYAIEVRGLGKVFRHYNASWARLLEWISFGHYAGHQPKWALKDVNFTISPGESVAILGQNGAGKSTLLSLLLGTSRVSEGEAIVRGEATGLLELGLGLQSEFTGRDNAILQMQMRGLPKKKAEADGLIEAIKDFSELGDAFDWPLRTYSTGMQMRLGFAAATVMRPDILIVDEALAVGDAHFQYKCIQRIKEYKEQGTTLLFVSHDLPAMRSLCERGILLHQGQIIASGAIDGVLDRYNQILAEHHDFIRTWHEEVTKSQQSIRSGSGEVRIEDIALTHANGDKSHIFAPGDAARLSFTLEGHKPVGDIACGLLLRNKLGLDIFGANTAGQQVTIPALNPGERRKVTIDLTLNLGPGHYFTTLAAHAGDSHMSGNYDWIDNAISFEILPDQDRPFVGAAKLPIDFSVSE